MNVMIRRTGSFDNTSYVTYVFSGGYEYKVYSNGIEIGYTPKGNYTSFVTTRKLSRIASEYEDRRVQIQD